MREVRYDAVVIRAQAWTLYEHARRMAFWSAVRGAFGWLIAGFAAYAAALTFSGEVRQVWHGALAEDVQAVRIAAGVAVTVLMLFGGSRGWAAGGRKGWALKLEAQQLLCQVQIEQGIQELLAKAGVPR